MVIGTACAGRIESVVELHQGRLSDYVAEVVTDRGSGGSRNPVTSWRHVSCECGGTTTMCKACGSRAVRSRQRLEERPELSSCFAASTRPS